MACYARNFWKRPLVHKSSKDTQATETEVRGGTRWQIVQPAAHVKRPPFVGLGKKWTKLAARLKLSKPLRLNTPFSSIGNGVLSLWAPPRHDGWGCLGPQLRGGGGR